MDETTRTSYRIRNNDILVIGERMRVMKDNNQWKIHDATPADIECLEILIAEMYHMELKYMDVEKFENTLKETIRSILDNEWETGDIDIYNDEAYFVVVPRFGFGTVEIPIGEIILDP